MSEWEGVAEAAEATGAEGAQDVRAAGAQGAAGAEATQQALAEHNALARVFDDVRACSRDGVLSEPARWAELGLVPAHMTDEDFEMFVYEYLGDEQEKRAEDETEAQTRRVGAASAAPGVGASARPGVRPVGVPPVIVGARKQEPADATPAPTASAEEAPAEALAEAGAAAATNAPSPANAPAPAVSADVDASDPSPGLNIPAGFKLVELEGEWVLVETDEAPEPRELPIDCRHVRALVGAHSYYLYDCSVMTDAFARWAYLAAEDDDVVTFAECVREESRVYPRPMPLKSLMNDPFNMTEERIERIWEDVRTSGSYPDIQRTEASNGEVFFYSTDHLTPTYAAALAEWNAVERYLNV